MYVADTHTLIYHSWGQKSRLGPRAKRILSQAEAAETLVHLPTIVLWEVANHLVDGRIRPLSNFEQWCRSLASHKGFSIVPLEWFDVNEARRLPFKDPADRLIVGTAIRLDLPLITRDREIVDSGLVETIW